ncbi:MAG TPA: HEAT repeat domain-containing protein [Candidatus Binatia bacterium]|jgi:hypothetical protein
MDRTATNLVAYAAGPGNLERRAAAMLLLSELELDEPRVVAVVADALRSETVLQDYALRYVEKLRPEGALGAVLALLDAADPGVRERARRLLVSYGAAVVTPIARGARQATRPWLLGAVDVLATLASGPAVNALVPILVAGDADLARAAFDALHRRIRDLDERARPALLRHLLAAAATTAVATSPPARLFFVRASGALELPEARRWLLSEATRTDQPQVRSEALAALAASVRREKLLAREVTALAAILDESDAGRFVRPVLELLEGHRFADESQALLLHLRDSQHVTVRSFALGKLGESEAPGAVKALLGSLDDAEAVRRSAAGSLRKIPEARQALMKRFSEATDPSAAFTMAETLAGYGLPWRRPVLEKIWRRYHQALAAEERIQGAFLHFLRTAAPDFTAEALRKESLKLMKAGRPRDAARLRQIVCELAVASDDDTYQLAMAFVKTRRRGLDAPFRRPDPALDLFGALEDRRFATATKLKRDRSLDPEELYAIGFALSEADGSARRLGEELLGHLATRQPRSKVGKSARNKLALAT